MIKHIVDDAHESGHRHGLYLLQNLVENGSLTLGSLIIVSCRVTDTAVRKGLQAGLSHFHNLFSRYLGTLGLITIKPLDFVLLHVDFHTADRIYHIGYHVKIYGHIVLNIEVQILV